jgi:hypothetical protein
MAWAVGSARVEPSGAPRSTASRASATVRKVGAPPRRRRAAERLFEYARERRIRVIADHLDDLRQGGAGVVSLCAATCMRHWAR